MLRTPTQIRTALILGALLAGVTAWCYSEVFSYGFIAIDDHDYVSANAHVQGGLTWKGIAWAFTSTEAANWHPITWISHMVDCQLFGMNAGAHHIGNVILHSLNSFLLLFLLWAMTKALWRSAFVAALFALHPLHVESVAWISERKDVLSTFFFLLALLAYWRYTITKTVLVSGASTDSDRVGEHSRVYYFLSLLLFGFGLMAKPMLVTLPFVLVLLDIWPLKRICPPAPSQFFGLLRKNHDSSGRTGLQQLHPLLALLREKGPFFVLSILASLVTFYAQNSGGAVRSLTGLPILARVGNALLSYFDYISKALWPAKLAVMYPYPKDMPWFSIVVLCAFFALLSIYFFLRVHRQPQLLVGWLWFLGTLVPVIGLVQVGPQALADRYMYIPAIGLFVVIVWGCAEALSLLPRGELLGAGLAGITSIACLTSTRIQVGYWQSSERLFRHALAVTKDNYIAFDGLGSALDSQDRKEEALACFTEAVRLNPNYCLGRYDFGTALLNAGRNREAVENLQAAVRHNPRFAAAHINLAKGFLTQGKLAEAEAELAAALSLTPEDPEAHYNFGTVWMLEQKLAMAEKSFELALSLKPEYPQAHANLAICLMREAKGDKALVHFAEAARLEPSNVSAQMNLGLAFLDLDQPSNAVARFESVLKAQPDAPGANYEMARALAKLDKTDRAMMHARKARELALSCGRDDIATKASELLSHLLPSPGNS